MNWTCFDIILLAESYSTQIKPESYKIRPEISGIYTVIFFLFFSKCIGHACSRWYFCHEQKCPQTYVFPEPFQSVNSPLEYCTTKGCYIRRYQFFVAIFNGEFNNNCLSLTALLKNNNLLSRIKLHLKYSHNVLASCWHNTLAYYYLYYASISMQAYLFS